MLNIRKILCPTDFSDCANQAVAQALFMAQQAHAELHLLHAIVLHGVYTVDPMSYFPAPELIYEKVQAAAESEMSTLLVDHQDSPFRIREVIRSGFSPGSVLLDYAEEEDIDLIVMGTHGRRGARHFLMGSVAEEVVRRAGRPVLTVREQETPWTPAPIAKIVAPVDFSGPSKSASSIAMELARHHGSVVDLLHVVQDLAWADIYEFHSYDEVVASQEALEKKSSEKLRELGQELGTGVAWNVNTVVGHPAQAIVKHAADIGADLIVMATEGHTGLDRLLLGSVSEKVLRLANCCVMTVSLGGRSILAEGEPDVDPAARRD